jgi:hypothetical protein
MTNYPPYVNAYNSIPKLFSGIKIAAVPPKVSQNFLESVLGLKSSSHRALIPLLKKLGFIDQANVPTQAYKDFREDSLSGSIMAEKIREAYAPLFAANEYAWKMNKTDLQSKLRSVTGAAENDPNLPAVTCTFLELSKLASWNGAPATAKKDTTGSMDGDDKKKTTQPKRVDFSDSGLGLSYTINLNLPATTEIEVFNAIFKSLRDNLLRQ